MRVPFQLKPQTIFFGGGTPTALTSKQLEFLLRGFRERLDLSSLHEWTIEANPGSVSLRKAQMMRELGVSRISLGVQSWNDRTAAIARPRAQRRAGAKIRFEILRDAGFENVNIDLMFGLPAQTLAQWQSSLEQTIALRPEHISTYCLTYEEDTEFFLRHARGEFRSDSDADAKFFETAMQMLAEAGYEHYEISNYARPGFSSAHNRVTGPAKIIWAWGRALFRLWECSGGKTLPTIGVTPIKSSLVSPRSHRSRN